MTTQTPTPTRVVITIRGGILDAVFSSDPTLDVTLLDYDNAALEDAPMDPDEMEAEQARLTKDLAEVDY